MIYDEKTLDDFDIDNDKSVFKLFFDLLLKMDGTRITDGSVEEKITSMFNDACFICNAVIQMKRPYLNFYFLRDLVLHESTEENLTLPDFVRVETVLCMVYFLFEEHGEKTADIERFKSMISTHLHETSGEGNKRFEIFDEAYNNSGPTYLSSEFVVKLPITQERLDRVCWSAFSNNFDEECLRDIVGFWKAPQDRNLVIDDIKKEIEMLMEDEVPCRHLIRRMTISKERSHDLFDFLESMRLPEEPVKYEVFLPQNVDKKGDVKLTSPIDRLNDPSIYCAQIPFLIYDENRETIISRTVKGINDGNKNPYEVDWEEVTLYETNFVRELLEGIDSKYIMDVAQAIDDEEKRHAREDGQYTNISSDFYGTGQGNAFFYSYLRDNWQNDSDYVSAETLAEGILEKRNKAEAFRKKNKNDTGGQITEVKRHTVEIFDDPESHLHVKMKENIIDQSMFEENNALRKECNEWKKKYEENLEKKPEKAFNTQTGRRCFTNRQMGILLTAVGRITEKDNPPGKTTLGDIVERIAGYMPTTAGTNMKGKIPSVDTETVAAAIESKFPNLAAEVRKLSI